MRARVLTLAALAVLLVLPLAVEREAAYRLPSGASPLNTGPEGTSRLAEALSELGYGVAVVDSWTSELERLNPCLVVIVSPELPYSDRELEAIRRLAESGAGVLVADEGTYSNRVLESLGVPVRVTGRAVHVRGEPVFQAATRLGGVELEVVYAYPSALEVWGEVEVVARAGGDVLAAAYDAGGLRVLVVGDGTVLTNALLGPANALNPNFMLALHAVRSLCPAEGGTVLIEGSKYPRRPPPPAGAGSPLVAYLDPASRVLGVLLLLLVARYLVPPRSPRLFTKGSVGWGRAPEAYEVARLICENAELSRAFSEECLLFSRTRKARVLLEAVAAATRRDRDLALRVLRAAFEGWSSRTGGQR